MSKEKLGMRMKRFREINEITLKQLAERTGLSLSFLKSLEEDLVFSGAGAVWVSGLRMTCPKIYVQMGTPSTWLYFG